MTLTEIHCVHLVQKISMVWKLDMWQMCVIALLLLPEWPQLEGKLSGVGEMLDTSYLCIHYVMAAVLLIL